jgi:hypothetical protein
VCGVHGGDLQEELPLSTPLAEGSWGSSESPLGPGQAEPGSAWCLGVLGALTWPGGRMLAFWAGKSLMYRGARALHGDLLGESPFLCPVCATPSGPPPWHGGKGHWN